MAEQAGRTGRHTQATRAAARKGAARATRAGKATVTEPKKATRTS